MMKANLPFVALTLAPLVAFAACDAGPCENTGSCGDYPGGAAGTSGAAANGGRSGASSHGGTANEAGAPSDAAGAAGGPEAGGAPSGGGGGGAGEGGAGGESGGAGGAPSMCDATQSPSLEPCLVSDELALFVAPTGDDSSSGTQSAPVKTLSRAVELATVSGKIVIACNARFDEALVLTSAARIYGGFACPTEATPWLYEPGTRTEVKPITEGAALSVLSVLDPVVIEDLDFAAMNATRAGGSSIGALVLSSPDVTLRRTRIVAGNAAAGANGARGANGADGDLPLSDQRGGDAVCGAQAATTRDGGRWLAPSSCGSRGGTGGQAQQGDLGFPGASGTPQVNVEPEAVNNGGSAAPATPANAPGGAGNPGSPGRPGSAGVANTTQGSFSAQGFTPATNGGRGGDGFPGQGGGGGAASNGTGMCIGASGGAGGMGGCGGKGGAGGGAGGASVALISWQSDVTLDACELVAKNGGAGGKGGDGGAGGLGKNGGDGGLGLADSANNLGPGGKGGKGGDGGAGGPGSGGNGGPAYAIVSSGPTPMKLNETTLEVGSGGAAGPGGTAGATVGAAGTTGLSAEQLALTK